MNYKLLAAFISIQVVFISSTVAQRGFTYRPIKKVEIPFEYKNDLIVVKVLFQGLFPLKFIFDTGAEHTILSKIELAELTNLNFQKEFNLIGSDMTTEVTAYLATGAQLQIADMLLPNKPILVLKEDYLKLEEIAGMNIHGIIGADIFKRFVVEISYTRKVITFTTLKKAKRIDEDFVEMNMEFYKNKPYIKARTWFNQAEDLPTKYLIDTGAALATLIHNNSHAALSLPEDAISGNLAVGLGGELKGYLARVKKISFAPFEFEDIVSNFQDVNIDMDTSFLNGRNGIIGNQILNRFDVTFNYPLGKMYLRPNRKFKKRFEFDKSGLVLFASGSKLTNITVFDVLPNSPAKEVGLHKNDVIKKINGVPISLLSLGDVNRILKKKEGKKIKVVVKRAEERRKFVFKLRRII